MTAPNAHEPSARHEGEHEHPSDVWMPTMLRPAPEPVAAAPREAAEPTVVPSDDGAVAWHRVPEPPEPPWRASNRSRMVALAGGRAPGADPQVTAELQRLREEATTANERLTRQRALLDQLDLQLAEARRHATAEGIAARQAERRVAELNHQLALAHEELERLRALELVRIDRVVAQVDDHHRSLVAALRADTALIESPGPDDNDANSWYLGSNGGGTGAGAGASSAVADADLEADADDRIAAEAATAETPGTDDDALGSAGTAALGNDASTDPTLLALRHWLSPDDAMLIVDGDALAAALAQETPSDAGAADHDTAAGRSAAVAALRHGLQRQAPRSAIVFDGSRSTAAPEDVLADPDHEPRVLVTAPGVEVTTAVGALIGRHEVGSVVLAHETVAAAGVVAAQYRLGVDALAAALTSRS
ncbi:MAG: hypothetical protein ACE367_21610 [Acidimicrobiales bacterium]